MSKGALKERTENGTREMVLVCETGCWSIDFGAITRCKKRTCPFC